VDRSTAGRGLRARLQQVKAVLPAGDALDDADFARRHRAISALLWLHVLAVPLYGLVRDQDPRHVLAESALVAALAMGAGLRTASRTTRAVVATLGLVTSSAVLTHFSGGLIELHFHFFVVVAVVALYQSWVPFLAALAFVVIHHGLGGQMAGQAVFNHRSAMGDAWRWALVHGGFILAESAACLVAWRLNELALRSERAATEAMQRAHDDLAAAQAMAGIGSWDWDLTTDEVWWSAELYRIVGRDPATFEPTVGSFLDHVVDEDRPLLESMTRATRDGTPLDVEVRLQRCDGTRRVVHLRSVQGVAGGAGSPHVLGTCQDVTDRKALEAELQHLAFHDDLTGLANRALFLDRLEHGLAMSRRSGTPIALIYLDLDDFKTVNDSLGHVAGDRLLRLVAGRLQAAVRDADTVARLGGDEFALLLEATDADGAARVAGKVLELLIDPVEVGGTIVLPRASLGIAVAGPGEAAGDVLRHADIAMYAAKRHGKHGYRLFDEGMQASLTSRMQLEQELRAAIAEEQLVLHYQPLVDLATEEVTGVEALVRWDHPQRGMLPPSEFIAVAEETGMVRELGAWVLHRAAADLVRLQRATGRPLSVSVNVAAPQLDGTFVAIVRAALAAARLAPEHLVLEITETCLVRDDATIVPQLATLRRLGVRIAIDDFGTGYSSLAYLRTLPIDHLKIDRAFIRDVTAGPEGSALAHSIIKLGTTFNLHVVAEGIETPEQAAVLRRLGCHSGQGYLYRRPSDLESLQAVLGPGGSSSMTQTRPTRRSASTAGRSG
jgi:diguanylate cyclase (GGDEF)-like protein